MSKIEVGYCDYHNPQWVDKYDGLTYADKYQTKIDGNTFYIIQKIDHDIYDNKLSFISKYFLKKIHYDISIVCIIPMIKIHEETIRDVLRSWNFNCKYDWLNCELEEE